MTPRRANLRVAHQSACPNANQTSLDSVKGCKCKPGPSYYTFHRGRDGKPVKGPRVRDRQVAERALRKLQVEIDEGRVGQERPKTKTFTEWADEYLGILAKRSKNSTVVAYRATLNAYATEALGSTPLAAIGNPELRQLEEAIRKAKSSPATLSKHLRHVSAILQAAKDDGLIPENPAPLFKKKLRLRVVGGVPPFTDLELARLWTSMETLEVDPVFIAFCKAAVTTGARAGELAAANVGDVDLAAGTFRIEHHYDRATGGLTAPKDGEPRTVHLIAPARTVLEDWLGRDDEPRPDDAPLFPGLTGGRLNTESASKIVLRAMAKAKPPIPKLGESGRPRKPLHSLRATFDRLCLERGIHPQWVQAELGHSTADLTLATYGEWTEAAKAKEAARVEALGFPV